MHVEIKAGTNNIHPSSVNSHLSPIGVTGSFEVSPLRAHRPNNLLLQATPRLTSYAEI